MDEHLNIVKGRRLVNSGTFGAIGHDVVVGRPVPPVRLAQDRNVFTGTAVLTEMLDQMFLLSGIENDIKINHYS
ncbi:MAG: hypothetical protein GX434_08095 [Peptococcaceae bacterium]|nr:hypothetical protein [Peptococcaceae bacterium]